MAGRGQVIIILGCYWLSAVRSQVNRALVPATEYNVSIKRCVIQAGRKPSTRSGERPNYSINLLNVFQVVLKKHKKFSIPAVTFTNGLTSNIVVKLPVSSNCSTEKYITISHYVNTAYSRKPPAP